LQAGELLVQSGRDGRAAQFGLLPFLEGC